MHACALTLQERLAAAFNPSRPAGRLDRPEWLLRLALSLVEAHAPAMAALSPLVADLGLAGSYHAATEYARAMQAAVAQVMVQVRGRPHTAHRTPHTAHLTPQAAPPALAIPPPPPVCSCAPLMLNRC